MKNLNSIFKTSALIDLRFIGPHFTWSNYRDEIAHILKRLDRVVVNEEWLDMFLDAHI